MWDFQFDDLSVDLRCHDVFQTNIQDRECSTTTSAFGKERGRGVTKEATNWNQSHLQVCIFISTTYQIINYFLANMYIV